MKSKLLFVIGIFLIPIFFIILLSAILLINKENQEEVIDPLIKVNEELIFSPDNTPKYKQSYKNVEVSFYNNSYCEKYNPACITASGEKFDDTAFTCACSYDFEIGDKIIVSYQDKSIEVICNDRGNFEKKYNRMLDLSEASFASLAMLSKGVIKVDLEVIE
jgi:rare lipoprotein A (peptidoglycan hydrolase)